MENIILNTNILDEYKDIEEMRSCFDIEEDVSDNEVMEIIQENKNLDFDAFMELIKVRHNEGTFIIYGDLGLWHGRKTGYKRTETLTSALYACFEDLANFIIKDEDGELIVSGSHHDGSNTFTIRKVTDRGLKFIDTHEFDVKMSEAELCIKLYEKYSEKINLGEKIIGEF